MLENAEIGYIIGGSIAGLVVFVAIVALVVYMLCGSRGKRRRQEKKFQQLARHPEPGHHSQASTMSHMSAERLPKVGSNGLWVGAPGVYASSPSPAYFYGRPYPPGVHRASSETRLPPFTGPAHAVYQSNNNMGNLRIYHSQQLSPVYEYIDPTQGPMYEYGDIHHSRSRLIEQPSSSWKKPKDKKDGKKIPRSKSDATQDQRRHNGRKRSDTNKSSDTKTSSKSSRSKEARAEVHNQQKGNSKSKSVDTLHTGYDNKAFERDSGLATDSMKLQASKVNPVKNITDDEKQVITPAEQEVKEQDKHHYVYKGDIYAVPDKSTSVEESNNPILAKMDNIDRDRRVERPARYLLEDEVDSAPVDKGAKVISSAKAASESTHAGPSRAASSNDTNIIVTEVVNKNDKMVANQSENTEKPSNLSLQPPVHLNAHNSLVASPSLMSERSELSEDLDVKGKNVTTAAFQFLSDYLSDEEDGHTENSRPASPTVTTLHTDQGMY